MSEKRGKEKLEVSDREQGRFLGEGQLNGIEASRLNQRWAVLYFSTFFACDNQEKGCWLNCSSPPAHAHTHARTWIYSTRLKQIDYTIFDTGFFFKPGSEAS